MTPSPRPTAPQPAIALFTGNFNGCSNGPLGVYSASNNIAEYNAVNGVPIEAFATNVTQAYGGYGDGIGIDDSENLYLEPCSDGIIGVIEPILKIAVGGSSPLAMLEPSATILETSVAPTGEVVSCAFDYYNNSSSIEEWDPGASGPPSRVMPYGGYGESIVAVGPDGTLYLGIGGGGSGTFQVNVYAPDSSTLERTMTESLAPNAPEFDPSVMVAASDGTLYVGEWAYSNPDPDAGLYVFTSAGKESVVKSMDPGILGLDLDASDDVYVASNNAPYYYQTGVTDTSQQFSVYSAHATTLLRQFSDHVPGVDFLNEGPDGSSYLIQYPNDSIGAPNGGYGAVYRIPPGGQTATDLLVHISVDNVVFYSNGHGTSAKRRAFGSGHSAAAGLGMSARDRVRRLRSRAMLAPGF